MPFELANGGNVTLSWKSRNVENCLSVRKQTLLKWDIAYRKVNKYSLNNSHDVFS